MEKLFSNEIVFRGHPDKVCDQISGALLDALIEQDPDTRAGIEVMGGKSAVYIAGEITSSAQVDFIAITKRVLEDCGYDSEKLNIVVDISKQSADIALGVDKQGAGDNGMMFGYACNDTPEMLPPAVVILQQFAEEYDELRKRDSRFKSDGKAQITGVYRRDMELAEIKTFTICYQNTEEDREEMDSLLHFIRGAALVRSPDCICDRKRRAALDLHRQRQRVIEAREEDFEGGRVEKIREKYKQEKFEELAKFGHFTR